MCSVKVLASLHCLSLPPSLMSLLPISFSELQHSVMCVCVGGTIRGPGAANSNTLSIAIHSQPHPALPLYSWAMMEAAADKQKSKQERKQEVFLRKKVGLFRAVSLLIGTIIGSGIFISPKGVLDNSGSIGASLVIWVLCGILSMLGMYSVYVWASCLTGSGHLTTSRSDIHPEMYRCLSVQHLFRVRLIYKLYSIPHVPYHH